VGGDAGTGPGKAAERVAGRATGGGAGVCGGGNWEAGRRGSGGRSRVFKGGRGQRRQSEGRLGRASDGGDPRPTARTLNRGRRRRGRRAGEVVVGRGTGVMGGVGARCVPKADGEGRPRRWPRTVADGRADPSERVSLWIGGPGRGFGEQRVWLRRGGLADMGTTIEGRVSVHLARGRGSGVPPRRTGSLGWEEAAKGWDLVVGFWGAQLRGVDGRVRADWGGRATLGGTPLWTPTRPKGTAGGRPRAGTGEGLAAREDKFGHAVGRGGPVERGKLHGEGRLLGGMVVGGGAGVWLR